MTGAQEVKMSEAVKATTGTERKKITQEMREKLREPFPPEAISQHPTKTFLSTIKAIFIVERLNDVFGIGRWTLKTEVFSTLSDYVLMQGSLEILDYDVCVPAQYGGHTTTGKNTELADGYKSAVTDCLSKCASYLEVGIDVFKGLQSQHKTNQQKSSSEISQKQRGLILKIGKEKQLTDTEIRTLVSWVAKREKIANNHWKVAQLLLPEENFKKRMSEHIDFLNAQES